jgi:hypothetical protein
LIFPAGNAPADEITKFGFALSGLINRAEPVQSLLVQMPTNRLAHPGGERIRQGSVEEQKLLEWVRHLASLAPSERFRGSAVTGPLPSVLRRLTHSQYNNAVEHLLGDQTRPARYFPSEDFVHGFKNQADGQSISPLLAESYARAAARLALSARRSGVLEKLSPCRPARPADESCAVKFAASFGKKAFRRPLTEAEQSSLSEVIRREGARSGDFWSGAQMAVQVALQSPSFLFRTETGPYAAASQLSFLLWNAPPDSQLLELAQAENSVRPGRYDPRR